LVENFLTRLFFSCKMCEPEVIHVTITERLKELKAQSGLTTKEIAARSGLPEPTLEKIFAGRTQNPGVNSVQQILYTLGCTLDDLGPINTKKAPSTKDEASDLAKRIAALDSTGRGAVSALIGYYEAQQKEPAAPAGKIIPFIQQSMAAGSGEPDFGNLALDTYEAPGGSLAQFACRVHGDSLEPILSDQSVALAVRRDPAPGEVGVFLVDGEYVIKQYAADPYGNVYLFAVNRARSDTDRTLLAHEEHTVYCLGTLLLDKRLPLPDLS